MGRVVIIGSAIAVGVAISALMWVVKPRTRLPPFIDVLRSQPCEPASSSRKGLRQICSQPLHDGCDFLTQRYCRSGSTPLRQFQGELAYCMGRRTGGEHVSCALVGSSSHLLSVAEGASIDAHDVVIRVNSAPDGSGAADSWLAPCVGRRTTVRLVNQYGLTPKGSQLPRCILMVEPAHSCAKGNCFVNFDLCPASCDVRSRVQCRPMSMRSRPSTWNQSFVLVDSLHPSVGQQILLTEKKRGVNARTAGFTAFTYALGACDHITVYGYGKGCDGKTGARYYKGTVGVALFHPYSVEHEVIEDIAKAGPSSKHLRRVPGWMRAAGVTVYEPPCLRNASGPTARLLPRDRCVRPDADPAPSGGKPRV